MYQVELLGKAMGRARRMAHPGASDLICLLRSVPFEGIYVA